MISKLTRCRTCLGIGTMWPGTVCPTCHGNGTADESGLARRRKSDATPAKTVITISRDKPLQMTRTALLLHVGYSVVALTSDAEVTGYLAAEARPSINLILLCHSVPEAS